MTNAFTPEMGPAAPTVYHLENGERTPWVYAKDREDKVSCIEGAVEISIGDDNVLDLAAGGVQKIANAQYSIKAVSPSARVEVVTTKSFDSASPYA